MREDIQKHYSNHLGMSTTDYDFTIDFYDIDQAYRPDEVIKQMEDVEGTIFAKGVVRVVMPLNLLEVVGKAVQEQISKRDAINAQKDSSE